MVVHSLFIINKAGSLMYHHDFVERPRLDENDYLRLGSAFHAFHVISGQLAPQLPAGSGGGSVSGGIQTIETNTFRLQSFHSLTGVKFFVTADPGDTALDDTLAAIYAAYCDYVLKNPFYELDQVISKNAKFDAALTAIVAAKNPPPPASPAAPSADQR